MENFIGKNFRIVHPGTIRKEPLPGGRRRRVLSYGAGVDSFWGGVQFCHNPDPYWQDLRDTTGIILHSDLGSEMDETTWHLHEVAMPMFRAAGWDITIIKPRKRSLKDEDGNTLPPGEALVFENIFDYYWHMRAFPTHDRTSCSPSFKIEPCQGASEYLLGTDEYDTVIFYEHGEEGRIKDVRANLLKGKKRPETIARIEEKLNRFHYPPIVWQKNRRQMEAEIRAAGYPVPIKSRCFWCLHTKEHEIRWMDEHRPDLLARMIAFEERCIEYRTPLRAAKEKAPLYLLDPSGKETVRQIRDRLRATPKVQQMPFSLEVSGCWKKTIAG